MTGYAICATPRSGSTLLCALLRASGVAGWPESWFRIQNRAEWAADWNIARKGGEVAWPTFLAAAIRAGRRDGPVFGLRLMWDHFEGLRRDLGGSDDLEAVFGPMRYIHLSRRDRVAQAVSRHKAEASGTWHLGFEEAAEPRTPHYDFAAIDGYMREAEADHASWHSWFASKGIQPLEIAYEDLAADPRKVARTVLAFLGLPAPGPLAVTNRRMADVESADWAARFRAEAAQKGS
jgi:trehalose 2-sulfotransferase